MVAGPADVDSLHLAGRECHWCCACFGEQHLWSWVALPVFADLGAQLGGQHAPGGGKAEIDHTVGVLWEEFVDATVVAAQLVVEQLELIGEMQGRLAVTGHVAVRR